MIELIFNNSILILDGFEYSVNSIELEDKIGVFICLSSNVNQFTYRVNANQTTINGVLQTSAQMIIDTLTNGQS